MSLLIVPCTLEQANQYVRLYHRTHTEVLMARFCMAVASEQTGLVHGVAIVGLPLSRMLTDGYSLEVRRLCSDGTRNACSMLYGACWKAAKATGHRRLLTYTLPEEGGASLRAVGWRPTHGCGGHSWNVPSRPREETPEHLLVKKTRWEITVEEDGFSRGEDALPRPVFPRDRIHKKQEGRSLWELPEQESEYSTLVTVE